jgi:hypothetical protein
MIEPPGKEKSPRLGTNQTEGDSTNGASQIVSQRGQTRKEFAGTLGVSQRTVARYLRDGKLIVTRTPGGQPRIHGVKQFPASGTNP